ncbi:MAG: hypothetical protein WCY09_08670 [Candidatus Omnitrophota bacterium]
MTIIIDPITVQPIANGVIRVNPIIVGNQLFVRSTLAQSATTDPSAFDPLLWLKADAITGLSDSDPVALWSDSGNDGNNATQAVVANKPIYKTNIVNGKPAILFGGATGATISYLNLSGVSMGSAFTVLLVAKILGFPETLLYGEFIVDAENNYGITTGKAPSAPIYGISSPFTYCVGGEAVADTWQIIEFDMTHTYVNGVDVTIEHGGTVDFTGTPIVTIGSDSPHVRSPYILVPEIIIFGSALSDSNRLSIEQHLATKYALTLGV